IKNSTALIASGDKDAVAIFEEYNKTVMPSFAQFSDGDIDNILAYIKEAGDKKPAATATAGAEGAAPADTGVSSFMIIGLVAVVLIAFLVIVVLNRVIGTLERLLVKKEEE